MADELRFGIVGLGMGRHRAGLAHATPGARLVAVCDIWEERGRSAAQEYNCDWIPQYTDLLAREDIDVIGVYTPSGMHSDFARMALEAGKHAFTSKPMDIRLGPIDAAIKVAEETGLALAVDFDSRYNPINHRIRAALQSDCIGRVIIADLRMKWFRAQDYYSGGMPEAWRSKLATEGGSLANQAIHYLDLLQWWLGPVETVYGNRGTFAHNIETEDATCDQIRFRSGAMGSVITTTCSFPDLGTAIEITGTMGTLSWKDQELVLFEAAQGTPTGGHDRAGYARPEFAATPEAVKLDIADYPAPPDLPANIIADMVGVITEGRQAQCDAYEGRKSAAILEGAYRSSDTGVPVSLA